MAEGPAAAKKEKEQYPSEANPKAKVTGSNVSLPAIVGVVQALTVYVPVGDLFSAEGTAFKKEYIKFAVDTVAPCDRCIFPKVQHLKGAEAKCDVHKQSCPASSVETGVLRRPFLFEDCFSCKNFSSLCNDRDDLFSWSEKRFFEKLLGERFGSIGIPFGAALGFYDRARPEFVLWESVQEAGTPNHRDVVLKCSARIGYACAARLFGSAEYDSCPHRQRAWGVVQDVCCMCKPWGQTLANATSIVETVEAFRTEPPCFHERILREDHVLVKGVLTHLEGLKSPQSIRAIMSGTAFLLLAKGSGPVT